jgi:hypothetical protein
VPPFSIDAGTIAVDFHHPGNDELAFHFTHTLA